MIYILVDDYMDVPCEAIKVASTDIQDILDYLSLDNIPYLSMTDYEIIIRQNKMTEYYDNFDVTKDMYNGLVKYPPRLLLQSGEFEEVKNKIKVWCENITIRLEEERKRKDQEELKNEEEKERREYERLKAKFENE